MASFVSRTDMASERIVRERFLAKPRTMSEVRFVDDTDVGEINLLYRLIRNWCPGDYKLLASIRTEIETWFVNHADLRHNPMYHMGFGGFDTVLEDRYRLVVECDVSGMRLYRHHGGYDRSLAILYEPWHKIQFFTRARVRLFVHNWVVQLQAVYDNTDHNVYQRSSSFGLCFHADAIRENTVYAACKLFYKTYLARHRRPFKLFHALLPADLIRLVSSFLFSGPPKRIPELLQ